MTLKRFVVLAAFAGVSACGSTEPKPVPTTMSARSSTTSTGTVGQALAAKPTVRVLDAAGIGVEGVEVAFAVTDGGGSLSATTGVTDAEGVASSGTWTLGTVAGLQTVTASVPGLTGSPVTFTATASADVPAVVTINGGNSQTAIAGTAVAVAPSVKVVDQYGNVVVARSVTFTIASGGGNVSQGTVTTNTSGIATVGSWTLGPTPGANGLTATVTSALTASFSATGIDGPSKVAVLSGDLQAANAGAAVGVAPSVQVTNGQGIPVPGVTVNFAVGLGGGSVTGSSTTTDANGIATAGTWTLGATGALNTLIATVPAITGANNAATVSASGCIGGGAGYKLTICITTDMTATQRAAFTTAAAKWATVITGDIPDITFTTGLPSGTSGCSTGTFSLPAGAVVDDLLIFAQIVSIDGPGNILGQAGPCQFRTSGGLSVAGTMRFDVADVNNLETQGRLNAVILHEMGHVIGVGTLWNSFGLLVNPSSPNGALDTHFNGVNGIAGFDAVGGTSYVGNKVPVENTGGSGTINAHWRESVLQSELMTGFISGSSQPLSLITARSLQDMGYTVDVNAADTFSLVTALVDPSSGAKYPTIFLGNDALPGPLYAVDNRGRIVRRIR